MKQLTIIVIFLFAIIDASAKTIQGLNPSVNVIVVDEEFQLNISMPVFSGSDSCNVELDWGDGNKEEISFGYGVKFKPISNKDKALFQIPHVYKSVGTKIINVKSTFISSCEIDFLANRYSAKVISKNEKILIDEKQSDSNIHVDELVKQKTEQKKILKEKSKLENSKIDDIRRANVSNGKTQIGEKQILECYFSYSVIKGLIENFERKTTTKEGSSLIKNLDLKINHYLDLQKAFIFNQEDKKRMVEILKSIKATDGAKNISFHYEVIDKCEKLENEEANSKSAEAIVRDTLGLSFEGDDIKILPTKNGALSDSDLKIVSETFSARKSPWSSFKLFFEYSVKGYYATENFSMYYDVKSFTKKDSIKKILTYEISSSFVSGSIFEVDSLIKYYKVALYELNRKEESYRNNGIVLVRDPIQKEKVIGVTPNENGWHFFQRNTEVEKLYQLACE